MAVHPVRYSVRDGGGHTCTQPISDQVFQRVCPLPREHTWAEKLQMARDALHQHRYIQADNLFRDTILLLSKEPAENFRRPNRRIRTAMCYLELADCQLKLNRTELALGCLQTAGQIQVAELGVQHMHTSDTLLRCADCLIRLGRPAEAIATLDTVYRTVSDKLGRDSPLAAECCVKFGEAHLKRHDLQFSVHMFAKAMKIRENLFGCTDEKTVDVYHLIGSAYLTRGELPIAIEFLEKAADLRLKSTNHEATADSLAQLGVARLQLRQYDHAFSCLDRALYAYCQILGEDHEKSKECKVQLDRCRATRRALETLSPETGLVLSGKAE